MAILPVNELLKLIWVRLDGLGHHQSPQLVTLVSLVVLSSPYISHNAMVMAEGPVQNLRSKSNY